MQMQYTRDIPGLIAHSVRENALLVVLVLLHFVAATLLARHFHFPVVVRWSVQLVLFVAAYLILVVLPYLWLIVRRRPGSPIGFTRDLMARWRFAERVAIAAPALLAMLVFLPTFSALKAAIPVMAPYYLDPELARLDLAIHGEEAWLVIQPLVGHPIVSYLLNGAYHLWLVLLYLVLCAVAIWVEDLDLRRRFLVAFVLCWALLGNLAATLLSSVGPCFYGLFYHQTPFSGLMAYLNDTNKIVPIDALRVQGMLADWARSGMSGLGHGISAMPSMHVSLACLFMLLSWKLGARWAVAGTLFLISILLGSVHLAYHYAVDGYAALIATPAIWWVSKHLTFPARASREGSVPAQPGEIQQA